MITLGELYRFVTRKIGLIPSVLSLASMLALHFWGFVIRADHAFFGVVDFNFFSIFFFILIGNFVIAAFAARFLLITLGSILSITASLFQKNRLLRQLRIYIIRRKYQLYRLIIYIVFIVVFFSLQYLGFHEATKFLIFIGGQLVFGAMLAWVIIKFGGQRGGSGWRRTNLLFYGRESAKSLLIYMSVIFLLFISFLLGSYRMDTLKMHKEVIVNFEQGSTCAVILGSTSDGYLAYLKQEERIKFFPFGAIDSISQQIEPKCLVGAD